MSTVQKKYSVLRGLTWHRHQYYSLFSPVDWHHFNWTDGGAGEIHGPDPSDPLSMFGVGIKDMNTRATVDDLSIVSTGFLEAIELLPDVQIEVRYSKLADKVCVKFVPVIMPPVIF